MERRLSCGPAGIMTADPAFSEGKRQRRRLPRLRIRRTRVWSVLIVCLFSGAVAAGPPAAKPKASGFDVVPWSLTPALGATEARLNMRAERQDSDPAPGTESIIVFGKRLRRAPVEAEELRRDAPGAESWQSEAAQSYVPGMGDTCTYKSGCFDKAQPGLLSTIPSLFGNQ